MQRQTPLAALDALGNVLRVRRAHLRISQVEAAKRAGVHPNYFGSVERGEVNPTYTTLQRLASGLGMTLGQLAEQAAATATEGASGAAPTHA